MDFTVLQMESANRMRPSPRPAQSSQRRKQKQTCNSALSPAGPFQESQSANSSCPTDSTTHQEAPFKTVYEVWTDATQSLLFQWLELPANYEKWKCAGVKNVNGGTRTSALTKKAITYLIFEYLDTMQTKKSPNQVMSKMRYTGKKFKKAKDFL